MKVPIPVDWDGSSWCAYQVCWPDSEMWRAILRGFITQPMKGRFWDERTGSIQDVQAIGVEIWLQNIPLAEVIMSCNEAGEIANAIRFLATQLSNNNCCGGFGPIVVSGSGVGGAGLSQETASPIDDTDQTGDPPEGFASWAEWRGNKCRAAQYIIDQWQADIARAQTINFVAGTLLPAILEILSITVLSPIPGDELVALAALILLAISEGVIEDALTALANCLTDAEAELLCALYEGTTVPAGKANAQAIFDDCLSTVAEPTKFIAGQLANNWLNNDNLNRMFELAESVTYPSADCSGCIACELNTIAIYNDGESDWGEIVTDSIVGTTRTITANASLVDGQYRFGLTTGINSGCCWIIGTINDPINTTNALGGNRYDCDGIEINSGYANSATFVSEMQDDTSITAFTVVYDQGPWDTITISFDLA